MLEEPIPVFPPLVLIACAASLGGHLNRARAGLAGGKAGKLAGYRWSSLAYYAKAIGVAVDGGDAAPPGAC